jgi:hypothetical protein
MKRHSCASIRPALDGYVDGELRVSEQIAVELHLRECPECASEVAALRNLGAMLRNDCDLEPGVDDALDETLRSAARVIVARVRAEQHDSIGSRVSRMFEDLNLVWAGLAATTAAATCAAVVAAVLAFAPPERADSLAGILSAMASPGSDRNPVSIDERVELPRVHSVAVMPAMLVTVPEMEAQGGVSFAVTGVLTREGRVANAALLPAAYDLADSQQVIRAVSAARFTPAQRGGTPVAVNLIWLFEQTTVKGKRSS